MTVPPAAAPAVAASDRLGGIDVGLVRPGGVVAMLSCVGALFVASRRLQRVEAGVSARLAGLVGVPQAHRVGSAVIFRVDGSLTGYQVTLGCTVAFLVIPFFAVTAGLLAIRRVPARRAITGLVSALMLIMAFNQVRLLAIGVGMAVWGPKLGYSVTHVFIGTLISTLGVVAGGSAYLLIVLAGGRSQKVGRRG